MLWGIGLLVLLLAICTQAFPLNIEDDYDSFGRGVDIDNPINEERRSKSAALWFHRTGKSATASAPLWFSRFSRSRYGAGYHGQYADAVGNTPPLWFHRVGKSSPVAAPMWFHGKRSLQQQLTLKDLQILQEMLEQAGQR